MKKQVAKLLNRRFHARLKHFTDAGRKIGPWIPPWSSNDTYCLGQIRGYSVLSFREVQIEEMSRRFSSPSVLIRQDVAKLARLQHSSAMPVKDDGNHQNGERRTLEKQKDESGVSDYWGIVSQKIHREDGAVWPWNCFKPTEVHVTDVKIDLEKHHKPESLSDKLAFWTVKALRVPTDLFFQKRYGCRAMMLETVAAVPGMVGGMLLHLKSLRRFEHSGGWIKALLEEAENERMHLMTFMEVANPVWYERALVMTVQGIFFNAYFLLYLASPRMAHRVVGYLEEEAIYSYTQYLKEIDNGHLPNGPAPAIAIDYWRLPKDATIRDVVIVVRADEAHHRDVNHFASDIKKRGLDLKDAPAPVEYR